MITGAWLAENLRRRRSLLLAVVVLIAAGSYGLLHYLLGPAVLVENVVRTDLIQTIVASGRIETPLRVDIGSQITGAVAAIPVAEGQAVSAGQLLILLDDDEAKAAVEQARAAVLQAQAKLKQIGEVTLPAAEQAARQAEVTLNNVRRQYQRTLQLQRQGFIGQAQLDDAQRNLEVAQSQLRAARLQVDTNTVRGSDYLLARAALAQALAAQRMAAARLDYTRITAPLDGILIARNVERGDVVQPGKALMVLSPAGQIQVVVQIDEKNLPALRLGQKALASADAYPEQRFATELVYLNPAVDPQRGSVEAKFRALDPPAYLRQDMTVSVDIEVAHRRNAVVVPVESVHDGSGNGAWVLTVSGRHARRRAVRTGVRGSGKVEIVDGLVPGEQVIASTAAGIVDGQRVRPVAATGRSSSGPAPSASVRSIP